MAHFAIPSHIFIGNTALAEAMPYIKEWGGRAFIVTGKHVGKSPMMQQLKKALEGAQIPYYVFDGITGEPTDAMIETGLALYKKTGLPVCHWHWRRKPAGFRQSHRRYGCWRWKDR